MKNLRVILWVALGLALLVNYSTWTADFAPRDAAIAAAAITRIATLWFAVALGFAALPYVIRLVNRSAGRRPDRNVQLPTVQHPRS
jgi:nitrate/nitrite transporter NarK